MKTLYDIVKDKLPIKKNIIDGETVEFIVLDHKVLKHSSNIKIEYEELLPVDLAKQLTIDKIPSDIKQLLRKHGIDIE